MSNIIGITVLIAIISVIAVIAIIVIIVIIGILAIIIIIVIINIIILIIIIVVIVIICIIIRVIDPDIRKQVFQNKKLLGPGQLQQACRVQDLCEPLLSRFHKIQASYTWLQTVVDPAWHGSTRQAI